MRSCNSVHTSCTAADDNKGRQSVLGRPKPLKLVTSTLIWLEIIVSLSSEMFLRWYSRRDRFELPDYVSRR